jgi:hypothetical protein
MYIFVMQARIGLKTLPIDRKWFCTSEVVYNNITKRLNSFRNNWHIFRFSLFRVDYFSLISRKESSRQLASLFKMTAKVCSIT